VAQTQSYLNSTSATSKLFSNLGPRFSETKGGYLRVIKAGFREGDKADMCYVELTIRDLEHETKVDGELAEENLVMPSDELPETKTDEKTKETAPAPEEVKAPKKATKKTTTKKVESEESQTEVVTPKKPAKKTAEKKDTKTKTETKAATTKKPIKKKKAEKKEEKKSWWSRFFK
jgi:large subunit ribosomal protein L17